MSLVVVIAVAVAVGCVVVVEVILHLLLLLSLLFCRRVFVFEIKRFDLVSVRQPLPVSNTLLARDYS